MNINFGDWKNQDRLFYLVVRNDQVIDIHVGLCKSIINAADEFCVIIKAGLEFLLELFFILKNNGRLIFKDGVPGAF